MSVLFIASDDIVYRASLGSFSPISYAAWVRMSKYPAAGSYYTIARGGTGNIWLRVDSAGNLTASESGLNAGTIAGVPLNKWFHAAAVFGAINTRTPYLNGVAGTTGGTNASGTNAFIEIGGVSGSPNTHLADGMEIAELCVASIGVNIQALSRSTDPVITNNPSWPLSREWGLWGSGAFWNPAVSNRIRMARQPGATGGEPVRWTEQPPHILRADPTPILVV